MNTPTDTTTNSNAAAVIEHVSNHRIGRNEAAKILRVHVNSVDSLRRAGLLRAIPHGRKVFFDLPQVLKLLETGWKLPPKAAESSAGDQR